MRASSNHARNIVSLAEFSHKNCGNRLERSRSLHSHRPEARRFRPLFDERFQCRAVNRRAASTMINQRALAWDRDVLGAPPPSVASNIIAEKDRVGAAAVVLGTKGSHARSPLCLVRGIQGKNEN